MSPAIMLNKQDNTSLYVCFASLHSLLTEVTQTFNNEYLVVPHDSSLHLCVPNDVYAHLYGCKSQ